LELTSSDPFQEQLNDEQELPELRARWDDDDGSNEEEVSRDGVDSDNDGPAVGGPEHREHVRQLLESLRHDERDEQIKDVQAWLNRRTDAASSALDHLNRIEKQSTRRTANIDEDVGEVRVDLRAKEKGTQASCLINHFRGALASVERQRQKFSSEFTHSEKADAEAALMSTEEL